MPVLPELVLGCLRHAHEDAVRERVVALSVPVALGAVALARRSNRFTSRSRWRVRWLAAVESLAPAAEALG